MNQYQSARSAAFLYWNPNGPGILISTRFVETSQIQYVERPGGAEFFQIYFFDCNAGQNTLLTDGKLRGVGATLITEVHGRQLARCDMRG